MKCPKEIRLCPNGWEDCSLCRYVSLTNTCLYKPKSDIDIVVLAAKIAEKVVHADVIESTEKIKGNLQSDVDFWGWWGRSSPPNIHAKEPWKTMSGPTAPGGSTMKCKKETKGHKPTIYKWNEFK